MATEITFENRDALNSLFKPWDEPSRHRVPNPQAGGPAVVKPGRRASRCPLVRTIRGEVAAFRQARYAGASATTRRLLSYWFETEHLVETEDGDRVPFRYHWAQREAMETIAYLFEVRGMSSVAGLLCEYGEGKLDDIAAGIPYDEDRWAKYCAKVATGGGKTKVMSLAIVWSYFHRRFEPGSEMPQHFVVIAPNITVYERLLDDFGNKKIFVRDPLVPEDWKQDFLLDVVLQEDSGGTATTGALYLTNIHRLYESRDKEPEDGSTSIFGPVVKKAKALDTGETLRRRVASHPALMVLNDEAHHLHDPGLAWNKAIDTLDRLSREMGNQGVRLQLDFSATPKHNNGDLFRHIVCDFPLGEAVDAGIVKVPVLGESDDLPAVPDPDLPFVDRYHTHLQLGYQLYERSLEEWGRFRKPILFVMTEDTASSKAVAEYLADESKFPSLGGKVLDVHTKVKGSLKEVTRNGKKVKEFVEGEKNLKPDDLKFLRQLSRDLDSKDSPYRCVVSVLMLREGWDVKNVTTIVPLRAYSAKSGILPEQTLGRGLRRMIPSGDVPEKVVVVHHPAFRSLYEEELQQEGLDIATLKIREAFKETVTIFVDHEKKPVEELEIEVPLVSDAIETTAELHLSFEEVVEKFRQSGWPQLPIKERGNAEVAYIERHMFTDEVVSSLKLDVGLLASAATAVSYFVQMLCRRCRLPGKHAELAPLVEQFIAEHLFARPVNVYGGDVDHRMRDADVKQYVLGVFAGLVLGKTVRKQERKVLSQGVRLSTWKPYQASSTEKRPAVLAKRTMFNLVPCENDFETAFADFCDHAPDVAAFAKNSGPQKLAIDYLKPDGNIGFYWPDFIVRASTGVHYVVELKGKTDELVPLKAATAQEWCRSAGKYSDWRYLYVPYHLFQTSPTATLAELERACLPTLSGLTSDARNTQAQLALDADTKHPHSKDRVEQLLTAAGFGAAPSSCEQAIRESVDLLDYAIQRNHSSFSSAFTPLLKPLDRYAYRMLTKRLVPHLPDDQIGRTLYLEPDLSRFPIGSRNRLERNQRALRANLVEGRSMQLLGTLLFCLDYAQNWTIDAGGVWEDVRDEFADEVSGLLYEVLSRINNVRNQKIAHEGTLTDREEAEAELTHWIGGLCLLDGLIAAE